MNILIPKVQFQKLDCSKEGGCRSFMTLVIVIITLSIRVYIVKF